MNTKQRQLLEWLGGRHENPPVYANGGLAAAIARLRRDGFMETNTLTPKGLAQLDPERPSRCICNWDRPDTSKHFLDCPHSKIGVPL